MSQTTMRPCQAFLYLSNVPRCHQICIYQVIKYQGMMRKEYQKRSKISVSAYVVAILAVVTLIKDYYKI